MDLAVAILIILGVAAGIYLILTLIKLNKTLSSINSLIEGNKKNIDDTMKYLPEISSNVSGITKSFKGKTDMVDQYLTKGDEVAASIDFESLVSGISSIVGLFSEVKGFFSNKKKGLFK
jgi:uncharacterized protein YoxC